MQMPPPHPISVIIPTRGEAASIAAVVGRCRVMPGIGEVIVCDAATGDGTAALAQAAGARVVACATAGRARQQNAGAQLAGGDILLFMHADTWLPRQAASSIHRALADPRRVGGAFKRRFIGAHPLLAATSRLADLRCRWWGLGYGDQALFVRRDAFWTVGGFPEHGLDDVGLSRRLRTLAGRSGFAVIGPPIASSARRFGRQPLKRMVGDGVITAGLVARTLAGGRLCS
jgi:glycosyltransferase involved in cell wall biosynthesis